MSHSFVAIKGILQPLHILKLMQHICIYVFRISLSDQILEVAQLCVRVWKKNRV